MQEFNYFYFEFESSNVINIVKTSYAYIIIYHFEHLKIFLLCQKREFLAIFQKVIIRIVQVNDIITAGKIEKYCVK